MKKIIIISLILILLSPFLIPSVCFAEVNEKIAPQKYNTYGMVFIFDDQPVWLCALLFNISFVEKKYEDFCLVEVPVTIEYKNLNCVALTNKGTVNEIRIFNPMEKSYVAIWYPTEDGKYVHRFKLKLYAIGKNYILFIFEGNL